MKEKTFIQYLRERDLPAHFVLYLLMMLLAFVGSALAQFLFDGRLASNGEWQHAFGWQDEIVGWNIFGATIIIGSLRYEDPTWGARSFVVRGIVILTAFLGLNHLQSYIRTDVPWWHIVLAVLNIAGAIWGGGLLSWSHRDNTWYKRR